MKLAGRSAAQAVAARARALAAAVADNPSAELDLRSLLVAPKLGALLGAEVLLLGALLVGFLQGDLQEVLTRRDRGDLPIAVVLLIVTLLLTWVVPARTQGLLEGPRRRGYMDQIVTTGVSPLRYYAGRWWATQPLLLMVLGTSLPFVLLLGLLGGADWARTAATYGLLYAYGNLLVVVTFGLGVVMHEVAAMLLTQVTFTALSLLQLAPLPSTVAAWTPSRWIVAPFAPLFAGSEAALFERLYGPATPFGLEVPWPVWALGLWALLAGAAAIDCLLGPLHAFVPGLNNFGLVVLPQDQKKTRLSRFRPLLTRRIELAFLFENRGPRLVRATLPLRTLQQLALLSLFATLAFAVAFDEQVIQELRLGELRVVHGGVAAGLLVLSLFAFSNDRLRSLQQLPVGPWRLPQLTCDGAGFVLFLGLLVLLHATAFTVAWEPITQAPSARWDYLSADELFATSSLILAVLLTTSVSTFLVIRIAGSEQVGQAAAFLPGLAVTSLLVVAPLFPFGGAMLILESRLDTLEHLVEPLLVLAQASPMTALILGVQDAVQVPLPRLGFLARHGFWVLHPLWILYLGVVTWATQRVIREEAEVLEAQVRGEREAGVRGPPCAACGGILSVPLGMSWWGGVLAARALGYVRCLDCRKTHLARTGRPAPLLIARVLCLRLLAAAALLAVAWALLRAGGLA